MKPKTDDKTSKYSSRYSSLLSFSFLFFFSLILMSSTYAVEVGDGVIFNPTSSNNTYTVVTAFNASSVNVTATGLYINGSIASLIQNVEINLTSLLSGNQSYNASYDVTSGVFGISSCYINTQSGNKSLAYNSTINSCSGSITLPQNSSNSFYPTALDSHFRINTTKQKGVEVSLPGSEYYQDNLSYSSLELQHFLREFNITNNLLRNFTDISFGANAGNSYRIINVTNGTTSHNGSYSADFIEEDLSYTIAGDTFIVRTGYNIYKAFTLNNTLSVDLPEIMLAISLDYYDSSTLAEKQDGLLWPDLNSSYNNTHILFNLSVLNSSSSQEYRFSYDAVISNWSGESISDYVLSGEYRLWSLDRTYFLNFNLSNKIITENIDLTSITEWESKTATWGSSATDNTTSSLVSHTTTDGVTYAELSIPSTNYSTGYDYNLYYYTLSPITSSGESSGGGGGGGSSCISEGDSCVFSVDCCDGMQCLNFSCVYVAVEPVLESAEPILEPITERESIDLTSTKDKNVNNIPTLVSLIVNKFPLLSSSSVSIHSDGIMKYVALTIIIFLIFITLLTLYLLMPFLIQASIWLFTNPIGLVISAGAIVWIIIKYFL